MLQPRSRIHAPYTILTAQMTGTMHWDPEELPEILNDSLYDLHHPTITNENPPKEMKRKLRVIVNMIRSGRGQELYR